MAFERAQGMMDGKEPIPGRLEPAAKVEVRRVRVCDEGLDRKVVEPVSEALAGTIEGGQDTSGRSDGEVRGGGRHKHPRYRSEKAGNKALPPSSGMTVGAESADEEKARLLAQLAQLRSKQVEKRKKNLEAVRRYRERKASGRKLEKRGK